MTEYIPSDRSQANYSLKTEGINFSSLYIKKKFGLGLRLVHDDIPSGYRPVQIFHQLFIDFRKLMTPIIHIHSSEIKHLYCINYIAPKNGHYFFNFSSEITNLSSTKKN